MLCLARPASATPLSAGDIALTGFNADGPDGLAFVALVDVSGGDSILLINDTWNGSKFGNQGADLLWTAAGDVAAGTVITLSNINSVANRSASTGTLSGAAMSLSDNGQDVYAILGTRAVPVSFLAYLTTQSAAKYANTGLTASDIAVLPSKIDVAEYIGPRTGQLALADYRSLISNTGANWNVVGGGGGDQSGQVLPFDATVFVVVPEASASMLAGIGVLTLAGAGLGRRARRSRRE
jgi:hypothetical protein